MRLLRRAGRAPASAPLTSRVTVTMQAPKVSYEELKNMDKFLVQCIVVSDSLSAKDITSQMFMKETGKTIEEVKLKVYVMPPEQLSEVSEGRVGSVSSAPPPQQIMDNASSASDLFLLSSSGSLRTAYDQLGTVTGATVEQTIQLRLRELADLVAKLVEEKDSALAQNRELQDEVELLRREVRR